MIPQRVKLKGFLCYKDEQEIDFDSNATLWMLSGLNGSGKSSIFDAVTFGLFGHHRGGGTHNQELINKDSDGLVVEFEFQLDSRNYRVKRTLKGDTKGGGGGTQQLFRFDAAGHKWLPIEDTGNRDGFNKWISDNIGLNYETFTSSVLLLQGKADKLLDSKPEGRRAVLASIVDLERFERLHAKADEQRKGLRKQARSDVGSLGGVAGGQAGTGDGSGATHCRRRDDARRGSHGGRASARFGASSERLDGTARSAHGVAPAVRSTDFCSKMRRTSSAMWRICANCAKCCRSLHDIVRLRGEIHAAEVKTKNLQQEKQKAGEQVPQRESSLKQARDKRTSLQNLIAGDENKQRETAAQLLVVTAQMEKLKEHERHEAELNRIQEQLAPLPMDPSAEVLRAREKCDALAALNGIVPQLARFQSSREELRQALGREETASRQLEQVETKGKTLAAEVKRLEPLVEQADQATRQASERATEARTLHQQAQESLREITQLDGTKVCRHCGQSLTPGHLEDEKHRRGAEVQRAETRLKKDNTDLQAAQKAEKLLRSRFATAKDLPGRARQISRKP